MMVQRFLIPRIMEVFRVRVKVRVPKWNVSQGKAVERMYFSRLYGRLLL